jgi:uncharacterized protein YrrD
VYRLSEMIGKPVVSTDSGDKLGTISDALLDASAATVVGLVVRHGLIPKEHVLPLADVQRVGRDAVLARTEEHLMGSREWRKGEVEATKSSEVMGRRVVTAEGEQLGAVSDILIDEQTGHFGGLEVQSHSLGGLRSHRSMLPAAAQPRIGPDAVVVRGGVLPDDDGRHRSGDQSLEQTTTNHRGGER